MNIVEIEKKIVEVISRYLGADGTTTKLIKSDWKVLRHRDQQAAGTATSLTEEEYQYLLARRQAIRDSIPQ